MIKDIEYLSAAIKQETTLAYEQLKDCVPKPDSISETNKQLLNKAAEIIGKLSAKVDLLDMAIEQIKPDYHPIAEQPVLSITFNQQAEACIYARDLLGINNFRRIQLTDAGISYRWSGDRPVIELTLALDRRSPLELKLYTIALIKPRFSKLMKILIDGKHLRHKFKKGESEFVSSCVVPASDNARLTKLAIILPATFSPKELGVGQYTEKKGIAISRICFEKQL